MSNLLVLVVGTTLDYCVRVLLMLISLDKKSHTHTHQHQHLSLLVEH